MKKAGGPQRKREGADNVDIKFSHKNFVAKAIIKPYNVGRKVCGIKKEPY